MSVSKTQTRRNIYPFPVEDPCPEEYQPGLERRQTLGVCHKVKLFELLARALTMVLNQLEEDCSLTTIRIVCHSE
jgi:hypothetical protein